MKAPQRSLELNSLAGTLTPNLANPEECPLQKVDTEPLRLADDVDRAVVNIILYPSYYSFMCFCNFLWHMLKIHKAKRSYVSFRLWTARGPCGRNEMAAFKFAAMQTAELFMHRLGIDGRISFHEWGERDWNVGRNNKCLTSLERVNDVYNPFGGLADASDYSLVVNTLSIKNSYCFEYFHPENSSSTYETTFLAKPPRRKKTYGIRFENAHSNKVFGDWLTDELQEAKSLMLIEPPKLAKKLNRVFTGIAFRLPPRIVLKTRPTDLKSQLAKKPLSDTEFVNA